MFRRPEPVYDDIGRHPFPSRSVIDTFPVELKDYYLRVLQHLETGCDLEPASEAVIRLHSEQQQSTVDGSTDPNICDSETKSVEGVDSKSSARSSSIPPASSSKMSIKKGKTPPKKKNGSKNRYNIDPAKSSNKQRNIKKANKVDAGSRVIKTCPQPASDGVPNSRRCLLYALLAFIINPTSKEAVTSKFVRLMPQSGDTPMLVAINILAHRGMTLVRVTQNFQGGCMAYNLLQIRQCCRLIIVVRLWDLKRPDYFADHCVAWDGSIIHDRPKSVRVNHSSDRATSATSKAVFERIFHKKEYHRWQITNVYELDGEKREMFSIT